jgi:hypothetical protein
VRLSVVAVLALLPAFAAPSDELELRPSLALHARFTDRKNEAQPVVPFDAARREFALGGYLRPEGSDVYPSALASAGVEGARGRFRFALLADTGELRSQSFPARANVCFSTAPPAGLALRSGSRCDVLVNGRDATFGLDTLRFAPPQLTSNGRPFEEELRSTLLLREAWVGAALGRNDFALVRVGRKRFTVADGYVYDDWGTGAEASFDLGALGPSWDVGAALFYPSRDWPNGAGLGSVMLAVHADFLPSLFEHAGLFAAFFRDRSNQLVELFRGSLAEPSVVRLQSSSPGSADYIAESRLLTLQLDRPFTGDADVGWAGTSGSLTIGRARLELTAALAFGEVTIPDVTLVTVSADAVRTQTRYQPTTLFGQLARLRLGVPIGEAFHLDGFFLFLSGDVPPAEKAREGSAARYGGFLGVSPFITETNLFFNGGVAESFASRQATAPGVNARGVVAPGLAASYAPSPQVTLAARGAWLTAAAPGPFGGRVYGPEVDLNATYSPTSWLTLVAEADALFPGDFFAGRATSTKVVVGCDVVAF